MKTKRIRIESFQERDENKKELKKRMEEEENGMERKRTEWRKKKNARPENRTQV